MLFLYVLGISVVRMYVVRFLYTFLLVSLAIRGMGGVLQNSSILEINESTLGAPWSGAYLEPQQK